MNGRVLTLLAVLLGLSSIAAVQNKEVIVQSVNRVLSRGIRNNNPGNLRFSADDWKGLATRQTDSEFFQFVSPFWGIRAMARTLKNYQQRHGLNTVREIISRWAPNTENDTDAYVRSVERQTGIDADAPISVEANLVSLVPAIIRHENGSQPYEAALIAEGIAAA